MSDDAQTAADPFELSRFELAQEGPYPIALRELEAGQKQSHWMWFIFPQIAGLGTSPMAQRFAIQSRDEAAAYLAHPELGERLRTCAKALLNHRDKSAHDILGSPDDLKLHASATLFAEVSEPGSPFCLLLDAFFGGQPDPRTLSLLPNRPRLYLQETSDQSTVRIT